MKKNLITICARGGSKGIPGKNTKRINNIPLVQYSIMSAIKFSEFFDAEILVSTDDENIKKISSELGVSNDYIRPPETATDQAGKLDAIKHAMIWGETQRNKKYEFVLDFDVTSPLRTQEDLKSGFDLFLKDKNCLTLFSVNPAARNPYFNMVEQKENGYYAVVKEGKFLTRQSAPKIYDMNASFYFYRREFFDLNYFNALTERSLIYVMPHTCFDLDEPHDFEFMEYLITQNKLGFEI